MVTRHKKRASTPVPRVRRSALRSSRKSRGTVAEMKTSAVLTRELDEARQQQVAKDHRDGAALAGKRLNPDRGFYNNHVGLLLDDFFRHPRSIDIAGHPTIISADISAHRPANGLQRFAERRRMPLSFRIVRAPHPYCDLPHTHGLRMRRARPRRRRDAKECDEVAPSHKQLPVEDKAYQSAALCVTAKLPRR